MEVIGLLLVLLLSIVLVLYRLLKRTEHVEPIHPIRVCPFCHQGTLSIATHLDVQRRQGHSSVRYQVWKCNRCNYWDIADAMGHPLQEQGRELQKVSRRGT